MRTATSTVTTPALASKGATVTALTPPPTNGSNASTVPQLRETGSRDCMECRNYDSNGDCMCERNGDGDLTDAEVRGHPR